jgi:hypothetical protein
MRKFANTYLVSISYLFWNFSKDVCTISILSLILSTLSIWQIIYKSTKCFVFKFCCCRWKTCLKILRIQGYYNLKKFTLTKKLLLSTIKTIPLITARSHFMDFDVQFQYRNTYVRKNVELEIFFKIELYLLHKLLLYKNPQKK